MTHPSLASAGLSALSLRLLKCLHLTFDECSDTAETIDPVISIYRFVGKVMTRIVQIRTFLTTFLTEGTLSQHAILLNQPDEAEALAPGARGGRDRSDGGVAEGRAA